MAPEFKYVIANPQNSLCVPNLSGRLKDHYQYCDECDGQGRYVDEAGDPLEDDTCEVCNGIGHIYWGSWYGDDKAECFYCQEEDVLLAHMFDGPEDSSYVCLPCYILFHKQDCGCDLWDWAEKRILGVIIETKEGA